MIRSDGLELSVARSAVERLYKVRGSEPDPLAPGPGEVLDYVAEMQRADQALPTGARGAAISLLPERYAEIRTGGRAMTGQDKRNMELVRLMYNGDESERESIARDIIWHVPGHNPVSGNYHGFEEYTRLMPSRMAPLTQ